MGGVNGVKRIGVAALLGILVLAGCSSGNTPGTGSPAGERVPSTQTTSGTPPREVQWISPSKVEIKGYYPGGRAEYPLTIHQGAPTTEVRKWQVGTDASETEVTFDLRAPLCGGSFSQIQELVSDLPGEKLKPLSYDGDALTITIGGFVPEATRVVDFAYNADTQWTIRFAEPHFTAPHFEEAPPEAADWVIIADPSPVLAPYETRDVMVALEIPEGVEAPARLWEFWICATAGSGLVQAEMASRWLVSMKG